MELNKAKELFNMLNQYLVFYKDFLEFETKKLEDVANNRIKLLDEHVKSEEVYLLKSKGFEIKRQEFIKDLGFENEPMTEVIKTSPEEYKQKLQSVFEELSDTILNLQEKNKRCNSMIELRLHSISKTITNIEENKNKSNNVENKPKKEFVSRKV